MARPIVAHDVEPEPVEWLWRRRIPRGMITVVAGRPDQGKGLFAARIAADVTQASPVAEDTACNCNVLYSAHEDNHSLMTVPRLKAAGADLKRILLYRFRLPEQFETIKQIIEVQNIGLVIMDPFAASLSNGVTRFSDNVRDVLSPLTEFIEKRGTSIVIIEHALKRVGNQGHILDVIGGSSSGLAAAARAAYVFGVDPDDTDKRILAKAKLNLRDSPPAVSFDMEVEDLPKVGEVVSLEYDTELQAFDPMRLFQKPNKNAQVGRPPDKLAQACEWLTIHLSQYGALKSSVVIEDAKQAGMTEKTLRRAATAMKIVKSAGGGKNVTWDLNDDVKEMLGLLEPSAEESEPVFYGPLLENGDYFADPTAMEIEAAKDHMDDELSKLLGEGEDEDGEQE